MENYKILLLTDSPSFSEIIENLLTEIGLSFSTLNRKEDLPPKINSERINLIISYLTVENSIQLIELLKQSNAYLTKKVALLLITDSEELFANHAVNTISSKLDSIDFENTVFDLLDASEAAYESANYTPDPNKHYNLTYLYQHAHSDENFVQELLTMFVRDMPSMLHLLEKEYSVGEMEKLSNTAHKMKSQMALLGLEFCKNHLETIEQNAINGLPEIPTLISEIRDNCTRAIAEIKTDFNL